MTRVCCGVWIRRCGVWPQICGVWQTTPELNPATVLAGQPTYYLSLRGLAGFEIEPYICAHTHAHTHVRSRQSIPAKPRKPRSEPLTCENPCGVWLSARTPIPAAKPRKARPWPAPAAFPLKGAPMPITQLGTNPIPARVASRALTAFLVSPSGCHVSTYFTGSHGYAQIGWHDDEGRTRGTTAHRAAWVAHTAEQIPQGYTVDHTCKTRRCVNPEHLRLLSNFENARRTFGRDWPLGECINGHPNSELCTRGGKRMCRLCSRDWQRRYRAKKRALADAQILQLAS